jgi:ribosome maturation factor RimP
MCGQEWGRRDHSVFCPRPERKLEVREEVRLLALPLAEEAGYEVVDVEFSVQGRHRAVRVLLDKPGGITVGDCGIFSRRLADCLDMNQILAGSYHLEVSSPGLDRPIRTLEAVDRFRGRKVTLTLREPRDQKRNYEGELLGPDDSRVGIRLEDGREHWFEWGDVKSTRLVVDPWEGVRHRAAARGEG